MHLKESSDDARGGRNELELLTFSRSPDSMAHDGSFVCALPGPDFCSLAPPCCTHNIVDDHFTEAPSGGRFRRGDLCAALKNAPFQYWRDPFCMVSCAAYALNRWLLKPHFALGPFMRGHFADCLLIPAALPLVLWMQRRLGLRTRDVMPTLGEISLHLVVWALIAEGIGPWLTHHGTPDWWDVACYTAGAAICYVWWHRREIPCGAT